MSRTAPIPGRPQHLAAPSNACCAVTRLLAYARDPPWPILDCCLFRVPVAPRPPPRPEAAGASPVLPLPCYTRRCALLLSLPAFIRLHATAQRRPRAAPPRLALPRNRGSFHRPFPFPLASARIPLVPRWTRCFSARHGHSAPWPLPPSLRSCPCRAPPRSWPRTSLRPTKPPPRVASSKVAPYLERVQGCRGPRDSTAPASCRISRCSAPSVCALLFMEGEKVRKVNRS